jgi:hypothetical protein
MESKSGTKFRPKGKGARLDLSNPHALVLERLRSGASLTPPPADARPKSVRAREALASVSKMKWPPETAGTAGHVRAGTMLDLVGELFRKDLAGRKRPAHASADALNKRWIKRLNDNTKDHEGKLRDDHEGRLIDILRELGASRKEANNWVRANETPPVDFPSIRQLLQKDAKGETFLQVVDRRKTARVTRAKLYRAFLAWRGNRSPTPLSAEAFRRAIGVLPGVKSGKCGKAHELGWIGIGLRKRVRKRGTKP